MSGAEAGYPVDGGGQMDEQPEKPKCEICFDKVRESN